MNLTPQMLERLNEELEAIFRKTGHRIEKVVIADKQLMRSEKQLLNDVIARDPQLAAFKVDLVTSKQAHTLSLCWDEEKHRYVFC